MAVEKAKEDWMTKKWRPMMAITYMATIIFDFIVGPVIFNILQFYNPGQAVTSWTPLTLQGGGLYHLAMGAILGISAYTRGKEKEAMINAGMDPNAPPVTPQAPVMNLPVGNTPQQTWAPNPAPTTTTGFGAPSTTTVTQTFGSQTPATPAAPASGGFGSGFNSGFGSAPATTPAVNAKGLKVIPQEQQPEL
jgi:Holin of 3TMs, for gene-transfer release